MKARALLVAITLLAACGPAAPAGRTPECTGKTDCDQRGDGSLCVAGACVLPASPSASWMVEITPPPGSTDALTERPFPVAAGSIVFNASAAMQVDVTVDYDPSLSPPANADIVLTVPDAIPGRPDQSYVATAVPGLTTNVMGIPSAAIGPKSPATVTILPLPPDDTTAPPRTFAVTLLSSLTVMVADTDHSIGGDLREADSQPPANPFAARAFIAGTATAVSNQGAVRSTGSFSLAVPEAAAAMPLAVEVFSTSGADPTFTTSILKLPSGSPAADLGTILLPPYTSPNQFALVIQDGAQVPLSGALVTATTILSQTADGSRTTFQGGAVSGDLGVATLSLLPGTASTNLMYEIAVVPPAGSALATSCRAAQPVGAGGTPGAALTLTPAMQLPHRRVLAGTVSSGGSGVADVVVSATPGPAPIDGCTRTRAAPGTAVTDAEGRYRMPLDPGSYQLDYDPPAGAPFARATNPNGALTVTASADPTGGDVTLPRPKVVEARVTASDLATALSGATVRIFEPQCSGGSCAPPLLVGQAQTDATGLFRAVVPAP
jgi:hypothetical protein